MKIILCALFGVAAGNAANATHPSQPRPKRAEVLDAALVAPVIADVLVPAAIAATKASTATVMDQKSFLRKAAVTETKLAMAAGPLVADVLAPAAISAGKSLTDED